MSLRHLRGEKKSHLDVRTVVLPATAIPALPRASHHRVSPRTDSPLSAFLKAELGFMGRSTTLLALHPNGGGLEGLRRLDTPHPLPLP